MRGGLTNTSVPGIYYHGVVVIGIIIHAIIFITARSDLKFYGVSLFGGCSALPRDKGSIAYIILYGIYLIFLWFVVINFKNKTKSLRRKHKQ